MSTTKQPPVTRLGGFGWKANRRSTHHVKSSRKQPAGSLGTSIPGGSPTSAMDHSTKGTDTVDRGEDNDAPLLVKNTGTTNGNRTGNPVRGPSGILSSSNVFKVPELSNADISQESAHRIIPDVLQLPSTSQCFSPLVSCAGQNQPLSPGCQRPMQRTATARPLLPPQHEHLGSSRVAPSGSEATHGVGSPSPPSPMLHHSATIGSPQPLKPGVIPEDGGGATLERYRPTLGCTSSAGVHPQDSLECTDLWHSFVTHLPDPLSRPLLRALTLQVVTERLPMSLLTAGDMFDAYADLRGEIDYVQKMDSRGHVTAARKNGTCMSTHEGTGDGRMSWDLGRLHTVAPAVLRFRLNYIKELRLKEAIAQHEANQLQTVQKSGGSGGRGKPAALLPRPSLSRGDVAMHLFRPHAGSLAFGASLPQNMLRVMCSRRRLLMPSLRGGAAVAAGSNATSPVKSPGPSAAGRATVECSSAATFQAMPSIFLKGRQDYRRHSKDSTQRAHRYSSRRRRVTPFFEKEFAVAMACGHDASCLFATTFATEFLVGLPSFLKNPSHSTTSAIRATLHRMNLVLTEEVLRAGAMAIPAQRHLLYSPPLDLSLLYLRDSNLYYASTVGIEGKFFFLNEYAGKRRVFFDLEVEGNRTGEQRPSHGLDGSTMTSSLSGASALGAQGTGPSTFDMPSIVRGHADLRQLYVASARIADSLPTPKGSSSADRSTQVVSLAPIAQQFRSAADSMSRSWGTIQSLIPDLLSVSMDPTDGTISAPPSLQQQQPPSGSRETASLPCAVVMATQELWSVLSGSLASDLLRVLLLLDGEAASYTEASHTSGGGGPHATRGSDFVPLCSTAHMSHCSVATSIAPDGQQTSSAQGAEAHAQSVHRYIHSLTNCFTDGTRSRLEQFYHARVRYYFEIDERHAQTQQEKLDEELRNMAVLRALSQSRQSFAHHANSAAVEDVFRGRCQGLDDFNRTATRPLCDALSAALVAEADAIRTDTVSLGLPCLASDSSSHGNRTRGGGADSDSAEPAADEAENAESTVGMYAVVVILIPMEYLQWASAPPSPAPTPLSKH